MIRRRAMQGILVLFGCLLVLAVSCGSAFANPPEWRLRLAPLADYFPPEGENNSYTIEAENVGGPTESNQVTLKDMVPPGLTATEAKLFYGGFSYGFNLAGLLCPTPTECTFPGPFGGFFPNGVAENQKLVMQVRVAVPAGTPEGPMVDSAEVSGGGIDPVEVSATNNVGSNPPYGFHSFEASLPDSSRTTPYTQAGGHPFQFSTEFNFATIAQRASLDGSWGEFNDKPVRDPQSATVDLPPGLLANPQGVPHCSLAEFFAVECEPSTVVGFVGFRIFSTGQGLTSMVPLYNLQPQGESPGELGYLISGGQPFIINTGIRTATDYGVTAGATGILPVELNRVRVTLWGVPAEQSHDAIRGKVCGGSETGGFWRFRFANLIAQNEHDCEVEPSSITEPPNNGAAGVPPTPFVTMPTECSGQPLSFTAHSTSWQLPEEEATASSIVPPVDGCNQLSFEPTIEARPTTNLADAPSGLDFNLHVPQNEDPEGVATPELKEAVVKLPKGLALNPASGEGLTGCTEAQIGLHSKEAAHCPEASKLGSAEVQTPLLHEPLDGSLYLATPHENPSHALLAGYIVLEGQGVKIKLPGSFETDPQTGQITARFTENPQLPFEELKLHLFEGARGALRTPAVCGSYETTSELTPFSAPESGPPATPTSSFATTEAEHGGACPSSAAQLPNAPRLRAGTETPQAGAYSPFSLKLVREDGSQEVTSVETTLPKGLIAKIAGIPYCPDAAIAAVANKTGAEEQAGPSCPQASEVGTVEVGAGAGPTPIYVTGHAYLAGPYKGAPLSLAIITPAVAGPFDLGDVAVRVALHVDPETAQITAKSDEIPHILQGIPLDVRSITMKLSRSRFTRNPTSCEELHFSGTATSLLGTASPLSQRFQVGGCSALPFKPKLALKLRGAAHRGAHPALRAILRMPEGGANIASAQVSLPHTELLDQSHLNNVCTRVQLSAHACPPDSVYGYARASTPLLDKPLEGPVYLGTGYGHKLPDLVADLGGQIEVLLHGKTDTDPEGGLRNTFEVVPDAPVSEFVLSLQGGRKGLLQNSTNICTHPQRGSAIFTGQNGKSVELAPPLRIRCKGKRHGRRHHHRAHRRQAGR